eukprot:TRINITY_DN3488_c0_g1_i1.p1 TRINITY_DN3488_c0_g1~~TRINITY_DN3488_c0_g1_i1.p1  ORF type:complete len:113 (+),score=47.51 TRINITY_DN3488_c0_g1_i1:668-1006(+)
MEHDGGMVEEVEDNSDDDIMDEYEEEIACLAKFGIKSKEGSMKKVQGRVPIEIAKFCISEGSKAEEQKNKHKPEMVKVSTGMVKEPTKTIPQPPIGKGQKRKREKKKLSKKN